MRGSRYHQERERAIVEFESRFITALLIWHHGDVAKAARDAGLERTSIYRMVDRLNLRPFLKLCRQDIQAARGTVTAR